MLCIQWNFYPFQAYIQQQSEHYPEQIEEIFLARQYHWPYLFRCSLDEWLFLEQIGVLHFHHFLRVDIPQLQPKHYANPYAYVTIPWPLQNYLQSCYVLPLNTRGSWYDPLIIVNNSTTKEINVEPIFLQESCLPWPGACFCLLSIYNSGLAGLIWPHTTVIGKWILWKMSWNVMFFFQNGFLFYLGCCCSCCNCGSWNLIFTANLKNPIREVWNFSVNSRVSLFSTACAPRCHSCQEPSATILYLRNTGGTNIISQPYHTKSGPPASPVQLSTPEPAAQMCWS